MARMDTPRYCLDTNVLIAFLKGREPGASAVEKAVKEGDCYVTSTAVYLLISCAIILRYIRLKGENYVNNSRYNGIAL